MTKIELFPSKSIPLALLKANVGQVPGLPANPRTISPAKFEILKKSLRDNPEMLSLNEIKVFPFNGEYVVIGGNQRLDALQGWVYENVPCKIIPEDATPEQLRAYLIKDNLEFGDWVDELLSAEWDLQELRDSGMDNVERLAVEDIPLDNHVGERPADSSSTQQQNAPGQVSSPEHAHPDGGGDEDSGGSACDEEQKEYVPKDEPDISDEVKTAYRIDIICDDEQQQQELFDEFSAAGLKCKKLSLPQNV